MAQQDAATDEGESEHEAAIRTIINGLLGSSELATIEAMDGEIVEIRDGISPQKDSPNIMARVAFPAFPPIDARGDHLTEMDATFYRSRPLQGGEGYLMLIDVRHEGVLYGIQVNLGIDPEEV